MSDILIKGMEMPKGGYRTVEIAFDADGHPMALADGGDVFDVIPVQPHGRLGDLDALHKLFLEKAKEYKGVGGAMVAMAALCIANAPTIIPASGGNEGEEHTMDEFMYGQEGNPNDGSM